MRKRKIAPSETGPARTDLERKQRENVERAPPGDAVEAASSDSFPASDPPSWTGVRAGPP